MSLKKVAIVSIALLTLIPVLQAAGLERSAFCLTGVLLVSTSIALVIVLTPVLPRIVRTGKILWPTSEIPRQRIAFFVLLLGAYLTLTIFVWRIASTRFNHQWTWF